MKIQIIVKRKLMKRKKMKKKKMKILQIKMLKRKFKVIIFHKLKLNKNNQISLNKYQKKQLK